MRDSIWDKPDICHAIILHAGRCDPGAKPCRAIKRPDRIYFSVDEEQEKVRVTTKRPCKIRSIFPFARKRGRFKQHGQIYWRQPSYRAAHSTIGDPA